MKLSNVSCGSCGTTATDIGLDHPIRDGRGITLMYVEDVDIFLMSLCL